MGIERSTFLFDAEGKLQRSWRKVRVAGHVAEVLTAAQELQQK
jgi:peroxiredoxin Q/BCP